MNLQDILSHYTGQASAASPDHFDTVARELPPEVVGQGVSEALRSDRTPPFGDMVGQMFGNSNPQQQASVLNQLLGALGTGAAGGWLGSILGNAGGAALPSSSTSLTPDQAAKLTPAQVSEIAANAEKHDPSIIDRLGDFYAQHPQLVQTLGSAALAIALGKMANRMKSR